MEGEEIPSVMGRAAQVDPAAVDVSGDGGVVKKVLRAPPSDSPFPLKNQRVR